MESRYITSAAKPQQLQSFNMPEIAFVGRSNSGKSSLLNALLNRKNLARTSSTPGRTQMVNFFGLNEEIVFADLPGYGFNSAGKNVEREWDKLMNSYCQRNDIAAFLFLIDIRRDIESFETDFLRVLSERAPIIVVLTKTDKVKQGERIKLTKSFKDTLKNLNLSVDLTIAVSSLKKTGIPELGQKIKEVCSLFPGTKEKNF